MNPRYSCSLDLAEQGEQSFSTIGAALGTSASEASELLRVALTNFVKSYGGDDALRKDTQE